MHNRENLDEILTYILSKEADDVACKSTKEKGKGVFKVMAEEEEVKNPAKKEYN